MEYREATGGDAEAVAALHADSWRRNYRGSFRDEFLDGDLVAERLAEWRQRLEQPPKDQFVLMAVDGPELAGFVCVYAEEDDRWGSFVDNLHVAHTHRKLGHGTGLMHRAGHWLAAREARGGVCLWVLEANANARAFYHSIGASDSKRTALEVPGGGTPPTCRYTWASAAALRDGAVR